MRSVVLKVFSDCFLSSESKMGDCCMRLPGELNLWPESILIDTVWKKLFRSSRGQGCLNIFRGPWNTHQDYMIYIYIYCIHSFSLPFLGYHPSGQLIEAINTLVLKDLHASDVASCGLVWMGKSNITNIQARRLTRKMLDNINSSISRLIWFNADVSHSNCNFGFAPFLPELIGLKFRVEEVASGNLGCECLRAPHSKWNLRLGSSAMPYWS